MALRNPEHGSVIYYILIVVALFAALGFAASGMMRGPASSSINDEKLGVYAAEILSYAGRVRDIVKDMQISNDCEDVDLSFENPIISGYEHSPVATDECKIFGPEGISYIKPNPEWFDSAHSAAATYGEYVFTAATPVDGVGQDSNGGAGNDIAVVLNYLRDEICLEINNKAGITNTGGAPPIDTGAMDTTTKFTDSFAAADAIDASEVFGQSYGCVQEPGGTFNAFYYVLVAR